jgi:Tfp pilus assembly protein PilO
MSLLRRVFSERRAVVVPLTVFLVGNIAVLALAVWPLQRTVAGGKEAQWQATQNVAAARTQEIQAKTDRASKDRADIELRKFYTEILPKDDRSAIGAATFSLSRLADESHVTFKVGQWDREDVKDSTLTRLSGQVTLIGEYANVRRFLYEVETAQEFVIIESVELTSASVTQNDSMLELGLVIATYYRSDVRAGAVSR